MNQLVFFVIVFLDLVAVGCIVPLLPYYLSEVLRDSTLPSAQLVGGPIMGRLSDTYGRRTALLVSFAGSAVGYLMLGVTMSDRRFCPLSSALIRQPTASWSCQADSNHWQGLRLRCMLLTADTTEPAERSRVLGLLGTALSLGFILGNGVGAFLSTYSLHMPAFFASGVFVLDAVLALTFLSETVPAPSEASSAAASRMTFGLRPIIDVLKTPQIGFFVATFFVENFVFSLWRTTLSLFLKNSYALTPQQNGYVMMYFGLVSAFTNYLLIGRLVARMSEEILALACLVASAVSAGFLVFHSSLAILVVGLTPAMVATSIFNTCLSSILTKLGDRRLIGTTLGVLDSVDALGRTVAPTASGLLMDQLGASAPGIFVALTSTVLSGLYYLKMPRLQEPPKSKSE